MRKTNTHDPLIKDSWAFGTIILKRAIKNFYMKK